MSSKYVLLNIQGVFILFKSFKDARNNLVLFNDTFVPTSCIFRDRSSVI